MGISAASIVMAVYIPTLHKQHIFKEKYKTCYLFFSPSTEPVFQYSSCILYFILSYQTVDERHFLCHFMYFWWLFSHDTKEIWKK